MPEVVIGDVLKFSPIFYKFVTGGKLFCVTKSVNRNNVKYAQMIPFKFCPPLEKYCFFVVQGALMWCGRDWPARGYRAGGAGGVRWATSALFGSNWPSPSMIRPIAAQRLQPTRTTTNQRTRFTNARKISETCARGIIYAWLVLIIYGLMVIIYDRKFVLSDKT